MVKLGMLFFFESTVATIDGEILWWLPRVFLEPEPQAARMIQELSKDQKNVHFTAGIWHVSSRDLARITSDLVVDTPQGRSLGQSMAINNQHRWNCHGQEKLEVS